MTKDEFRKKYPLDNWVLSKESLYIGDLIAFWDPDLEEEIQAEITDTFGRLGHTLRIRRRYHIDTEIINFYDNIVFNLRRRKVSYRCSCGAKYTSNPKYHLPYCDLDGEEYE